MDGDRGRKLKQQDQPLTKEARDIDRRFSGHRLTLHVLKRYGIENYFPRRILETVLHRNLSAYFPIPSDKSIEKHLVGPLPWWRRLSNLVRGRHPPSFYRKTLNREIATDLTIGDIETTDLAEILATIKKRAEEVRQY